MSNALGFADAAKRADHYKKHRADFSAASEIEYEALAIAFLNTRLQSSIMECVRASGDIIRLDRVTQAFAIMSSTGVVKTYFKPKPSIHGRKTNLDYFNAECSAA